MREIKFRAWDTRKNVMREVVVLHFNKVSNISGASYWSEDMELKSLHGNYIKLMQYTGLKDSNGVEIYEGDVVSHDQGEYSFVGYVARDCYTFFIKGISQLESLGFEDVADTSKGTADLTIIGNIHENKELLEGE